jgi:hypothetical protein
MAICLTCLAEFHYECSNPEDYEGILVCCCKTVTLITEGGAPRGGPTKAPEEMADPTSTGRKRAAQLKPIEPGMVCEWKLLARAGGGVIPIIGCVGNPAKNIHHGPDKDTTNNADENLHRICSECHNRWHSLNDPFYGDRTPAGTPFVPLTGTNNPHDPETQADLAIVYDHELWWSTKAISRPPYVNIPKEDANV